MPDTPLTEILNDFRSYRPGNHRQFLEWVKDRAQDIGVREYAMKDRASSSEFIRLLHSILYSLTPLFSPIPPRPEPSPRFPLAPLVLHPRVHFEKNVPSDCHWRQSDHPRMYCTRHCLPITQQLLLTCALLPSVASQPAPRRVHPNGRSGQRARRTPGMQGSAGIGVCTARDVAEGGPEVFGGNVENS